MSKRPNLKEREAKSKITNLIFEVEEFLSDTSNVDDKKVNEYITQLESFEDSLLAKPFVKSKKDMIASLKDLNKVVEEEVVEEKPQSPFSKAREGVTEKKPEPKKEELVVKKVEKEVPVVKEVVESITMEEVNKGPENKYGIQPDQVVKYSINIEGQLLEAIRIRAKEEFKDIREVIEEMVKKSFNDNEIENAANIYIERTTIQMDRKKRKK